MGDLIEKINIKKFRALQENQGNEIEGPAETSRVQSEAPIQDVTTGGTADNLQEIDLTEEAINNDEVSVSLDDLGTYQAGNEETTTASIVEINEEETVPAVVGT